MCTKAHCMSAEVEIFFYFFPLFILELYIGTVCLLIDNRLLTSDSAELYSVSAIIETFALNENPPLKDFAITAGIENTT